MDGLTYILAAWIIYLMYCILCTIVTGENPLTPLEIDTEE